MLADPRANTYDGQPPLFSPEVRLLLCCAIPLGRFARFARLDSAFLLASGVIALAACTRSPASHVAKSDSAAHPTDSGGLSQAGLTDHYAKLLRAQLTAKDLYQAQVAVYCEASRIIVLLTNEAEDPLEGQNRAIRLLDETQRRTFTSADNPARDRVDSALAGQVFDSDPGCDSLARTGVLGDTVMPRLRQRR